jgi:hypothetical protein
VPCDCTRCRQMNRALSSVEVALRRPGALPAAAAVTGLLVLVPAVLVGIHVAFAVPLAAAAAGTLVALVLLLRPRLDPGADRLAPTAPERWLREADDDWPWWVLGGVMALVGLLLVTSPRLGLPLLLLGGLVAAVPAARRVLDGCARLA